jgi:hypothetical protein
MAKYFRSPDGTVTRKAGGYRLAERLESMGFVQVQPPPPKKRNRSKSKTYYVNGQYDGGN